MSKQIEVRVFECSQLEEEIFKAAIRFHSVLYGMVGVQGRASPSHGDTPSSFPRSSATASPPHQMKQEPQHVENVYLLQPGVRPTLGHMPERGLTRLPLYIVSGCPPLSYLPFRAHVSIRQTTRKSELKTFRCMDGKGTILMSELSTLCGVLSWKQFMKYP